MLFLGDPVSCRLEDQVEGKWVEDAAFLGPAIVPHNREMADN